VVLAGGRSSRFGRDKLVVPLDGVPLVIRAIRALAAVVDDVVVAAAPGWTLPDAVDHADEHRDVRVVADSDVHGGPLAGLATGLAVTRGDMVLVVGGDMPTVESSVLTLLAARLDASSGADLACLASVGGPQPLPIAIRRRAGERTAAALLRSGERRLMALLERMSLVVIAEAEWRALDPHGGSLLDVDLPADLPG
jgi:molybdopterin-guanine dinucleotide biosynthesis protein A